MNVHEQNDYLKEENRQLKEMLHGSPDVIFPREWDLRVAETRLLRSLCAVKGIRPHEVLLRACAMSDFVDENLLKVQISRIRKKLKPHGIEIKTVYGVGYELSEAAHNLVNKYLAKTKPIFTSGSQSSSA